MIKVIYQCIHLDPTHPVDYDEIKFPGCQRGHQTGAGCIYQNEHQETIARAFCKDGNWQRKVHHKWI